MENADDFNGTVNIMKHSDLLQPGLHDAFVKDGYGVDPSITPSSTKLEGMTLAVKDVFDVEGLRTGAGNPAWWAMQEIAEESAFSVTALLKAGAVWAGKTVTDELAYSLTGANIHYGTPTNPADVQRLPGGSSSGSAVAVAGGHVDIALATDCGGSARLPASYCGVWGIRPSHGYAGKSGFPLAPSFDTVGWFTRSGDVMMDVLQVLVSGLQVDEPRTLLIPQDALAVCAPAVQDAMDELLERLDLPFTHLPQETLPLKQWANAYRVLAGAEIWAEHGQWVCKNGANLAEDVLARFMAASRITAAEIKEENVVRRDAIKTLEDLLADNALILMPTVPGPAPLCTSAEDTLASERQSVQHLVSGAGLAGLPQVSFPWIEIDGAPVGLSVIGSKGNDGTVVRAAQLLDQLLSATQIA